MVRVADRNWIPFPVMGLHGSIDISHQMCMQFLFIYLFIYFSHSQNLIQHEQKLLIKL